MRSEIMCLPEGAEDVELPDGIYWLDRSIPETDYYEVTWAPGDQFAVATKINGSEEGRS